MTYQVKLEGFEGPLDLLLHLIKKDEIDIYNIPISRITEEYIRYLELLELLNLEIAGEFLVMAATLVHLKSRKLLPVVEKSEGEDEELDPCQELVRQLLEYKRYKEVAKILEDREYQQQKVYTRPPVKMEKVGEEEYVIEASLFDLLDAFRNVLNTVNPTVREIIQEEIRIEEKISLILDLLIERESLLLEELFALESTKMEIIVTFLALLELIKQKKIKILQNRLFDKIRIFRRKVQEEEALEKQEVTQEELNLVS